MRRSGVGRTVLMYYFFRASGEAISGTPKQFPKPFLTKKVRASGEAIKVTLKQLSMQVS